MALNKESQDVGSINLFRNYVIFEIAFSIEFLFLWIIFSFEHYGLTVNSSNLGVRLHGFNFWLFH